MILPLYDDNPRRGFPYASTGFLIVHVLVTVATLTTIDLGALAALGHGIADPSRLSAWWTEHFGMVSSLLFALYLVWQGCHLWVFADNVEDRVGTPLFITAYLIIGGIGWLVAGGTGAGMHGGFLQGTTAAMVTAYAVLYPRQSVLCVLPAVQRHTNVTVVSLGWILLSYAAGQVIAAGVLGVSIFSALSGVAAGLALGAVTAEKTRGLGSPPLVTLGEDKSRDARDRETKIEPLSSKPRSAVAAPPPPAQPVPARNPASTFLETSTGATEADHSGEKALLWAAIRLDDDLRHLDRLARLVATHTHETVFDVTRRLRNVRGLLATEKVEIEARAIAEAARAIDVPSVACPWPLPPLQRVLSVGNIAWSSRSIALVTRGAEERTFDIPWRRIRVAAGTRVVRLRPARNPRVDSPDDWNQLGVRTSRPSSPPSGSTQRVTLIDLIVEPADGGYAAPIHLSIEEGRCLYSIDAKSGGFQEVARALRERSSVLATNPGLSIIAEDKPLARWGYLDFRSERFRQDYLAWLSALAHPEQRGRGGVTASHADSEIAFLE